MRAYIYVGGEIDPANLTDHPKGDDLVIAADAGWNNAKKAGVKPMALLGILTRWVSPTCRTTWRSSACLRKRI